MRLQKSFYNIIFKIISKLPINGRAKKKVNKEGYVLDAYPYIENINRDSSAFSFF